MSHVPPRLKAGDQVKLEANKNFSSGTPSAVTSIESDGFGRTAIECQQVSRQ